MSPTIFRREIVEAAQEVAQQHRQEAIHAYHKARETTNTMQRTIAFAEHAANIDIARAFEAFADSVSDTDGSEATT